MSSVVVIPAYNAGRHIRALVERVVAAVPSEFSRLIVVNDGSTDHTQAELLALASRFSQLELLERARNGGYGAAMKDGLARAQVSRPELVACVHADGQYSPERLPLLVSELRARNLDLLQGSRIASGTALSGGMPLYKYVANACLNRIENHVLGLGMSDYHSGYLLYGRRALALPFAKLSNSFDFDLELIAMARAHRLSVGEAPIPTHYGDEISHLQPLSYGLRVLRVLWNYRRGRYDEA
jgi:glycosyltransferase involved in cell wall biosynthesis